MAKRAVDERRRGIVNQIARMFVDHIQKTIFKDRNRDEALKRIGISSTIWNCPFWSDIPEICDGLNLDVGLTIRDHKGHEVTLWPLENFSGDFSPRKSAEKKVQSLTQEKIEPLPLQRQASSR